MEQINYKTYEFFCSKRDKSLFSLISQAKNEEQQKLNYIRQKLGEKVFYKNVQNQRKKIECPENCGNTYVWIQQIYTTEDKKKRVLYVRCANTFCGEMFLVYQEAI